MDDLTPMEPSFQELPPEQPAQIPNYYGTGRPVQTKSHLPLILCLLALLLAANLVTITALARLRRNTQSLSSANPKTEIDRLSDAAEQTADTQAQESSTLDISESGKQLSLRGIYQKVTPSLAVITAQSSQGTLSGTGLLLTSDGYLLTHAHTVGSASHLTVTLSDGTSCAASFVGQDTATDLAVLRIEAEGLTAAEFGDSRLVSAGDEVAAFSNPFGETLDGTMTEGIISAINEDVSIGGVQMTIFQTNVTLLCEDAGGILVNGSGQIIAVSLQEVAGFVSYESVSSIGFALPAQEVLNVVNDLIRYGSVSGRPSLGLTIAALDEPLRLIWNLPEGVLVTEIDTDGDAYRAGLRKGDVISSINGQDVTDVASYLDTLGQYSAGDTLRIILYRNGRWRYTDVTLSGG